MDNLHKITRVKNKISFVYVEFAKIEQHEYGINIVQGSKETHIPITTINVLLLGPGTTITHSAVGNIIDSGCTVLWIGRDFRKFYAQGVGNTTHSSKNLLIQAKCYADSKKHIDVVRKMFSLRYPDVNLKTKSIAQMRGMEGVRVKKTYEDYAHQYGISWTGRSYKDNQWDEQNTVNKCLSIANNLLYNICLGAIISMGFSPAIGYIHTGDMMSFVCDIADLYKEKISIPVAFEIASKYQYVDAYVESELRKKCREKIVEHKLMKQLTMDLDYIFSETGDDTDIPEDISLWDVHGNLVKAGVNYALGDGEN